MVWNQAAIHSPLTHSGILKDLSLSNSRQTLKIIQTPKQKRKQKNRKSNNKMETLGCSVGSKSLFGNEDIQD